MKNSAFAITCAAALYFGFTVAAHCTGGEERLPPLGTSVETVKRVFEVSTVRPLDSSSFEPLRKFFSVKQQRKVDEFLRALNELVAKRNSLARRAGIDAKWWWPPNVDTTVHLITKDDPLTSRGDTPDTLEIGQPEENNKNVEITIKEVYKASALDGSDLGGAKTSRVMLVPENGRWVIDEVIFTSRQGGRIHTRTLSDILRTDAKRLRDVRHQIKDMTTEVRPAIPAR